MILLNVLKIIPLKLRLKMYYFMKLKRFLSLSNAKLYTEKLQVRKLNMLDLYSDLSDKYEVRKHVKRLIGEEYLIPLIGVYDSFDEIDFSTLPDSFVIKTNFGSGDGHLEIVKNKAGIDALKLRLKFNRAMTSFYKGSILGETQYDHIPRKIIIEQLIGNDIEDFKFHIFNNSDGFLQIDFDRFDKHKRNLYTLDYKKLNFDLMYKGGSYDLPSELDLKRLKELAFILAQGFDYVRVDLYLVEGKIYFGEMTFTPGCGFEAFSSVEVDLNYGQIWKQG